jgi:3-oxoacyl-[acyl-carrier-protein] synthase-3
MLLNNVVIETIAYELPPHRVTSAELEDQVGDTMDRLGVPRGRLEELAGIRERRFWDAGMTPSAAGARAARAAIEKTGIDPSEIGCIINASITRDYIEPATSVFVHAALGLSPSCINYDVSNACLGFITGIMNVGLMIETGLIRYGLVVSGDNARDVVEATIRRLQSPDIDMPTFRDNFATLTLGSSAVAAILCHRDLSRSGTGHAVNGFVTRAATAYNRLCVADHSGTQMKTDAATLLTAGVALAKEAWQEAERELPDWSDASIAGYAPHQVGSRHCAALAHSLALTPSKMFLNFMSLGNIGPAAVPVSLAQAAETGHVRPGDHVALMGIGSGLNCSLMSATW